MTHDVSSSFIFESRKTNPNVIRRFTIAGSDYSDRVMKWPTFSRKWDEIRPKSLQMKLANGDKGMNFLRDDKTLMENECIISMGFTTPDSGDELIDLFSGKMNSLKYSKEDCNIGVIDKFKQLSDRQIGTDDVPISFTGSNYLPSDLAWWAVTSYGGYSLLTSDNNPDIDWEAFNDWAAIFSGDSVLMQAEFDGQKCTEVLRKIARHTQSAIFIKENKISFHRYGIADPIVTSLGPREIKNLDLSFETDQIVNKQYVAGDYSVASDFHQFTVIDESSSSVNSFGLKENTLKDNNLWYVNSSSAINLAQRKILTDANPDDSLSVKTELVGLPRQIGETIVVTDDFHSISESYRILEHRINVDDGIIDFQIDRTQLSNPFILDTSTLGNTVEVLT